MKDDIKEILAYFEEYIKITDMHDSEPMLNWKDLKIVLDYITNLQQENERLIKELENVSLDEANIRADILLEQEDYKSRVEKAIEELFELKDMIYKPETREENFPIQRKISSIIINLGGKDDTNLPTN